jgi:hypothetical protein
MISAEGVLQRRIVETARERGFGEKHIAVMAFEVSRGAGIALGELSQSDLGVLLCALQKEKPELESTWPENAFELMCKCRGKRKVGRLGRIFLFSPTEDHQPQCAYRRFVEMTGAME